MNDEDGLRLEAAEQFGFERISDDCPRYSCTESQLIAFARACERKGRAEVVTIAEEIGAHSTDKEKGALGAVIHRLQDMNRRVDAELASILAAEETRFMTLRGYVRGTDEPGKRWVRPECCPVCGGDCASANPPVIHCPMREADNVKG